MEKKRSEIRILKFSGKCYGAHFSTMKMSTHAVISLLLILNLVRESVPILNHQGNEERVHRRQSGPDTFFGEDNDGGIINTNFPDSPVPHNVNNGGNFNSGTGFSFGNEGDGNVGQGQNFPFSGQSGGGLRSPGSTSLCNAGRGEICQLYSKCALFQPENVGSKGGIVKCTMDDDSEGICCKQIPKNRAETPALPQIHQAESDIQTRFLSGIGAPGQGTKIDIGQGQFPGSQQPIDFSTLESTLAKTQIYFNGYDSTEKRLLDRNISVKKGTSSFGHLLFFQTSKKAIELSRLGLSLVQSTKELKTDIPIQTRIFGSGSGNDLDADVQYGIGVKVVNVQGSSIGGQCPGPIVCDPRFNLYRTVDGSCNNIVRPKYGAALTPLMRLVQPAYADGIWNPRQSKTGLPLPSARLLSSSFNQDVDNPNPFYTLWVMQFGQFLDHDMSHVPVFRYSNGSGIECCSEDGDFLPLMQTHPLCLPIEIPSNDGFYRPFRQKCMNFVRSMVGPREDCSLGYADQLNQITSFLDSSNIYGSSPTDHENLREFREGRLKVGEIQRSFGSNSHSNANSNVNFFGEAQVENSRDFQSTPRKGMLPLQSSTNTLDECTDPEKGTQCFLAGDLRVNEMIGLTVTHLIWLREHNRVAGILKDLNPYWNDNQLFNEARRIVNAEYQHIVYNEWLPIVVGKQYMEVYGILPQATGYYGGYNQNINPSVSNAFAAAAFRMGHTLIQGLLPLLNEAGMVEDNLVIHEHFNKPFRIRERRMVDKLIRTLSTKNIQGFDQFITSEVTNRLFQEDHKPYGMDLISLNIQRARDHGVPGYNTYRQLCQLKRAKKFGDFQDWISKDLTEKLSRYYENVDDVDLFIGGILESPLPGALLGPTFTCIIGDQFARARKGDRFAYDAGPLASSFSLGQLYEIRKASFARILCDNGDNLATMQPYAFILPSQRNPLLSCDSRAIPRLDLSQWRISQFNS